MPGYWRIQHDALARSFVIDHQGYAETATDSGTSRDSVALRVIATVRRTADGGVAGIVQSAVVRGPEGALTPLPGQSFPFAFSAAPYAGRGAPRLVVQPPAADPCATPAAAALLPVEDLLFSIPDSVFPGLTWSDSSVTPVCRSGVRLSVFVVRTFHCRGLPSSDLTAGLVIDRTSHAVVTATVVRGTDTTRVHGSGSGTMTLAVDPVTGALLGATGTSQLDLTVRSATKIQQSRQTATIRISPTGG
ncbi:MAG TPA: hypothetical protein VG916_12570 [Gemmatimonadaceae bacterium]|nr:hypothetical protein [Gemmatimonadaceae bacterium]